MCTATCSTRLHTNAQHHRIIQPSRLSTTLSAQRMSVLVAVQKRHLSCGGQLVVALLELITQFAEVVLQSAEALFGATGSTRGNVTVDGKRSGASLGLDSTCNHTEYTST
eukprot:TRINITY_DN1403_c0_g1_i2.p1 TRINITY_DN1403_c0_g1~~TRINITY_DN1403_c0_g1_i2.p1  ORF type:complete len:110 (-),score=12.59 TRINITY_DN1403_c0_g1_i2:746-1075(-)